MATIKQLKEQIDLHNLAERLGLKRGKGVNANYHSPHHEDKTPSLAIYVDKATHEQRWKDFSEDGSGGSCIDLVMYVENVEAAEAIKWLHRSYNIPFDRPASEGHQPKSKAEYIADKCRGNDDRVIDYLTGRGISIDAVKHALQKGTLGFNTWTSDQKAAGEVGHGGDAVAFIVKSLNPGRVMAVDMRFVNPELNGGVKTQTQGEKDGYVWTADIPRLMRAHTVYAVESAINALSIDSVGMRGVASFAIRGTANAATMDLRFLQGKKVVAVMDNDAVNDRGRSPGQEAAWVFHERCTAQNIACFLVDQHPWDEFEYNDVNDIIQDVNADGLKSYLHQLQPWCIPGVSGADGYLGPRRLFLPAHDFSQYWRFRCKEDFTTYIKKRDTDENGNEKLEFSDLCGFRVAGLSRVTIAGAVATMTGEADTSPKTQFAVTVQTPRHGNKLVRRVFEDDRLHNVEQWKKFGPVFAVNAFSRMISILERGADIGAREAVNFVGLAWRKGRPEVNEGPDCYFTDPEQQCPYHNLSFPSGSADDARRVIAAYQATFNDNAAMQLLAWALGGHLKAFLGFWPHLVMQADKGSGKSTLIKHLERSIAFTMFSGQSLQTEFRLLTSICHTSHPVGWEEISARSQNVIDKAVSLLQESYQHTVTRRGADMTEFLIAAPVLLAGEDVPVKTLTGKVTRIDLSRRKGVKIPENLPRFPVLEWLRFLARHSRTQVVELHEAALKYCEKHCRASGKDEGASRMVRNYAAILACWKLLCEFSEISSRQGRFQSDLIAEMNKHIAETSGDREPWVWILETLFSEISSRNYHYPHKFVTFQDEGEPVDCLLVRPTHIMHHFKHSVSLKDTYNSLPVKTDRVLKKQLLQAEVVYKERVDTTIGGSRECHLLALSIDAMSEYGLFVSMPETPERLHSDGMEGEQGGLL